MGCASYRNVQSFGSTLPSRKEWPVSRTVENADRIERAVLIDAPTSTLAERVR